MFAVDKSVNCYNSNAEIYGICTPETVWRIFYLEEHITHHIKVEATTW